MTDYALYPTTGPAMQQLQTASVTVESAHHASANVHLQTPGADLIKAHIALLEKEVLLSQNSDIFRLVQHHYYRLQSWHDQHTGWQVQRSSTVIRLIRHLSATTPGYIYERLKEPRDFACLTWLLWYAENRQLTGHGNDQQFLLSQIAEQIQTQSVQTLLWIDNEHALDFRRPSDRYSIQRALNYLEGIGGLQLVDGQTREWVAQSDNADVLYEFTDVTRSLVSALRPQLLHAVAARLQQPATQLQPALLVEANTPPLARAWRALLLGPALFKFDDPEAFATLLTHADALANELLASFAWLLDIRRDYACIIRESGSASGPINLLTPYGTLDQITLLICNALRERIVASIWPDPDTFGCVRVTNEDMVELFYTVREQYGENWGNEARSKSSQNLLNDVYRKMRQTGMLRGPDESGTLLILPLAARYSATYDQVETETPTSRRSSSSSKAKTKSKSTRTAAQSATLPGLE